MGTTDWELRWEDYHKQAVTEIHEGYKINKIVLYDTVTKISQRLETIAPEASNLSHILIEFQNGRFIRCAMPDQVKTTNRDNFR